MSEPIKVPMSLGDFHTLATVTGEMTISYGGMYVKAGRSTWYGYTPQGQKLDEPYAVLTPEHHNHWEKLEAASEGRADD